MARLPVGRQVALLGGVAASVALGVALVLWSRTPNYGVLFSGLDTRDQSAVVEELQRAGIAYRVDTGNGTVMVPAAAVHDARLMLAKAGLPNGDAAGFELLRKDGGFGGSEMMEAARYQHALEGELARSIQSISLVHAARVHLAIPRQSAFTRNREAPSASVLVNTYPGRELDDDQVNAIRNMVAAGVPGMNAARVTVVDQMGRLLSARGEPGMGANTEQFEYTRRLEEVYVRRIENILTPFVGPGGVRAEVTLDVDFTVTEQTQEAFNPDTRAVRSEKLEEQRRAAAGGAPAGVAGALSNQPPAAGQLAAPEPAPADATASTASTAAAVQPGAAPPPVTAGSAAGPEKGVAGVAGDSSTMTMRNYELGKTISHTRMAPGTIRRLTAAVIVDHRRVMGEDGEETRVPLTDEEIARLTDLVRETVGYDEQRGDRVQVTTTSFVAPPEPVPLPEPPLLKQPWVWDIVKQVMGAAGLLALIFGVLRPMLRGLAARSVRTAEVAGALTQAAPAEGAPAAVRRGTSYEQELNAAKAIANQDPKRVAQVVKNWVASDA